MTLSISVILIIAIIIFLSYGFETKKVVNETVVAESIANTDTQEVIEGEEVIKEKEITFGRDESFSGEVVKVIVEVKLK